MNKRLETIVLPDDDPRTRQRWLIRHLPGSFLNAWQSAYPGGIAHRSY